MIAIVLCDQLKRCAERKEGERREEGSEVALRRKQNE